ncbi:hypothetical protein MPF83_02290 [Helicobacter pylori]|uniref:hypothetical protein n=1 Tax=Helicobacter pylori TaxID=210 RepID=UPI001FD1131C|nr:hypothetical protein [Helicobacter pylori]UOR49587.1 hypothetical protein MPF83_02290 [Helicobacter pylori]
MIIKIVQSQEVEISETQILHENINKSGCKNLKNERHVRMKDRCIIRDFIAPNKESFLTTTYFEILL